MYKIWPRLSKLDYYDSSQTSATRREQMLQLKHLAQCYGAPLVVLRQIGNIVYAGVTV